MSAASSTERPPASTGTARRWWSRRATRRKEIVRPSTIGWLGSATGCSASSSITEWRRPTGRPMSPRSTRRFARATPTTCCSSLIESVRESLKKRLGGGGGADLRAIDEVNEAVVTAVCRVSAEAVGPTVERVRRIAGRFVLRAAPQASVHKVPGDCFECRVVVVVDQSDDDAMPAQQLGEGGRREAAVAYLNHVAYRAAVELLRQQFEKGGETGFVERHPRSELPQHRPELVVQLEHAGRKEAFDRRAGCRQIGPVRDKTRALERKDEVLRCLVVPPAKTRRLLRAVEGAVDLDRGDLAARMGELTRLRQAGRIEDTPPRRKHPGADPDPDPRPGVHQSPELIKDLGRARCGSGSNRRGPRRRRNSTGRDRAECGRPAWPDPGSPPRTAPPGGRGSRCRDFPAGSRRAPRRPARSYRGSRERSRPRSPWRGRARPRSGLRRASAATPPV